MANKKITPWKVWLRAGFDVVGSLTQLPGWLKLSHEITQPHMLVEDFIGINIATNDDPQCDELVIQYVKDLGLNQVRMDYSYCSPNGNAQRLLNKVLAHEIEVMLDLFPSMQQASVIGNCPEAQHRWREFLQQVFADYHDKVAVFEIGSTPNRGKWSGFDGIGYLQTWRIANEVAADYQLVLAGPNISDFEPLYSHAFLKAMGRVHSVPAINTDNLFVERVIQPEAYDHRVAGNWATRKLNFNLIKKARLIEFIGKQQGSHKTYCTYKCWTRKRLNRWTDDPEQKNANYLSRYLFIAAASGALERVYWGPLICNRDGLIDCGDDEYPHIDNVSFYKEVRGKVSDFKVTKAYAAFKYMVSLLRNVTCQQGLTGDNGLNHFVFEQADGKVFHAVWTLDGYALPVSALYSQAELEAATIHSVYGDELSQAPEKITEQPLVLSWEQAPAVKTVQQLSAIDEVMKTEVIINEHSELNTLLVDNRFWRGKIAVAAEADMQAVVSAYLPNHLAEAEELQVLRDTRNRLWNVRLFEGDDEIQTVKLNRAKGIKKFTYRFLNSKGKRHWDNATEMLKRGINTPQPLAYFEKPDNSGIEDNYYVCRFVPDAFSARDVFTAFNQGELTYRGVSKDEMFDLMAGFVARMHNQNIIHRDLSSGNLMMTMNNDELQFYAIDIGRAVIDGASTVKPRHRFVDLKRICYKLDTQDRASFIAAYNRYIDKPLPNSWKLALKSYDWKQGSKKALKSKLKQLKARR